MSEIQKGAWNMEKRFERNIPSISKEEQELLKEKHVLLIGCGGIGGYVAEYLARAGLGKITIIDHDSFEESNLNRQLNATADTLGKSKVVETKERLSRVNPKLQVDFWMSKLRASTVDTALSGKDIVIDALDNTEDRKMLEQACARNGLYMIHGAVAGWMLQVMSVSPGSGSLKTFYDHNAVAATKSTLSFVPAASAAIQTAEVLKILLGKEPTLKDKMFVLDLKTMKTDIISPDAVVFAEQQIHVAISKYNQKDVYTVSENTTVREIVRALSLEGENLYAMKNGRYVMPEDYDHPILEEGDLLEFRKSAAFGG